MRRLATTAFLCAALVGAGCASTVRPRQVGAQPPASPTDATLMADYLRQLPAGTKVRIERTNGRVMRGRLMNVETDAIAFQKDTRVPETPISVPMWEIARVTLDTGPSTGTALALALVTTVGAGAGTVLLLLAAFGGF